MTKDYISKLVNSEINQILYMPVPNHEESRIDMINELIEVKLGDGEITNFEENETGDVIADMCTT